MTNGAPTAAPIKVLYIAGLGKSGSTIISMILGQVPGLVAVGEVRWFWERGLALADPCSCGRRFDECPFWSAAVRAAFPGGIADHGPLHAAFRRAIRLRRMPRHVLPGGWARMRRELQPHVESVTALYRAFAAEPGARVIVDESKLAVYAAWLSGMPELDLYVVHLVRDPRATAFSWTRSRLQRPPTDPPELRMSVAKAAALWQITNPVVERTFGSRTGRYLRIRYEDFAGAPRATLQAVLAFVGEPGAPLPFTADDEVELPPVHLMSSNRIARVRTGKIAIRTDDEWHTAMSRRRKLIATALSFPMLLRYGYRIRR